MSGNVFISYSRADRGYVGKLAAHLQGAGVPVWYDYELATGDRWENIIRERIEACAAVIVVMTPDADQSTWVKREINHAEGRRKPLFPLLLQGDVFFRLNDLQFDDVTTQEMPTGRIIDKLRYLVFPPEPASTKIDAGPPDDTLLAAASANAMAVDLRTVLVSPSGIAHVSSCPHKEDQDFSRWATISDMPDAWNRIGNGEAIAADSGSNPRLVAKKLCHDCVRRIRRP